MNFLAHPENAAGQPHLLKDHLRSVGALARQFAETANPLLAEPAQRAGLLHDFGKYRDEFQAYLREERESSLETHHAVYGAASLPYTFFLLNGDMELNKNRQIFVNKMF